MATIIQQLKGTAAEVAAKTYAQGLLVWNETAKRWHGGDGVTAGGIAMARYDERNDGAFGYEQRVETDASNAVTVNDIGKVIIGDRATAIAFNLGTAASLTSKFVAGFKNINAGPMTIVPNGAELIDGANTAVTVPTGSSVIIKGDGTSFRTFLSNGDVTGNAINNAAALTGANLADGDKLGVYDTSAAVLVGMTIAEFVAGIFKTARKIANGYFLSSFRLWDTTTDTKGLGFVLSSIAANTTRLLTMPDRNVDLGNVPVARFTSPQQTITSGGLLTIAHSMSVVPKNIALDLVNVNAGNGWSPGDVILNVSPNQTVTSANTFNQVYADATNIYVRFSNQAACFYTGNKTTGLAASIVNADWRLVVRAEA